MYLMYHHLLINNFNHRRLYHSRIPFLNPNGVEEQRQRHQLGKKELTCAWSQTLDLGVGMIVKPSYEFAIVVVVIWMWIELNYDMICFCTVVNTNTLSPLFVH